MRVFGIVTILLFASHVEAKKFDLDKQSIATYIKGGYGTSSVHQNAFGESQGTGATISEKVRFQMGAELGLLFTGKKVGFRAGVLLLSPQKMDAVEGKNGAGAVQYNLTSTILAVMPVGHFEFSPLINSGTRLYFSVGGGVGTVTLMNEYKMTTDGTATYSRLDFSEEGRANAWMVEGALGIEFSLADNATILFESGYRHLLATQFTHQRSANTFVGNISRGDVMKDHDGTKRELNLGSAFFNAGLRFYFN